MSNDEDEILVSHGTRALPEEFHVLSAGHGLADSGARHQTVTGSLREPKPAEDGRWDLIPAEAFFAIVAMFSEEASTVKDPWELFASFLSDGTTDGLSDDLLRFATYLANCLGGPTAAFHRIAVHYARGAKKYADRNWEKGQKTGWLVDSTMRHYKKFRSGATDEDHACATLWNVIALLHHLPRIADGRLPRELDDYGLVKS